MVRHLTDDENTRFLALFDESGLQIKAEYILAVLFNHEIKTVKINKSGHDFYMRLTTFHPQFREIGVNYNQIVKELKTNFTEKKALAFLYKLEKETIKLVELSPRKWYWQTSLNRDTAYNQGENRTRDIVFRGNLLRQTHVEKLSAILCLYLSLSLSKACEKHIYCNY